MKNLTLLSLLLLGMFMASCGGTKEIVEETPPATADFKDVVQNPRTEAPKKKDRRGPGMHQMFAELNMDDKQIAKYKQIDEKYRTKMRATMNGNDRGAMATKIKSLQDERSKEVKGILNKEQYAKYLNWMEKSAKSRGVRG